MNHWKTAARLCLHLSILVLLSSASSAGAQALSDDALSQIRFEQKLGSQVTLSLPFRDEAGRAVELGQYFGRKPVVLVLGYYECPMLCTLVLNGTAQAMREMPLTPGAYYQVVTVSFD
ncbi:MAG: SCO family protein, partial [Limisphaerales bacterium]